MCKNEKSEYSNEKFILKHSFKEVKLIMNFSATDKVEKLEKDEQVVNEGKVSRMDMENICNMLVLQFCAASVIK